MKVTAPKARHGVGDAGRVELGRGSKDDDSKTLSVIALIVGALGLLAGGAALLSRRRA